MMNIFIVDMIEGFTRIEALASLRVAAFVTKLKKSAHVGV